MQRSVTVSIPQALSLRRAAEALGVSVRTARHLVRRGDLPARRVLGRFTIDRRDLDEFAERTRYRTEARA